MSKHLIIIVSLGLLSGTASAGLTTIDFDDITTSAWDGDRYAAQGVVFDSPANEFIASLDSANIAHSGEVFVLADPVEDPIGAAFFNPDSTPTSHPFVSFWVIDGAGSPTEFWQVDVYNVAGVLVDSFQGNEGIFTDPFEVVINRPAGDIHRVVFTTSVDIEGIDTLSFGVPTPGTVALLGLAPLAALRRRR